MLNTTFKLLLHFAMAAKTKINQELTENQSKILVNDIGS